MKVQATFHSKCIKDFDLEMQLEIKKNPCKLCLMGHGMMCMNRQLCRWDPHEEIFVFDEAIEIKS